VTDYHVNSILAVVFNGYRTPVAVTSNLLALTIVLLDAETNGEEHVLW